MGRSNQDVGGYRGRRTVTDVLKLIAIALAVIVVIVLAAVFYLQRYIVYTDEGTRLDLPPLLQMFRRDSANSSADPVLPGDAGSVSVVIEPDSSQPGGEPAQPGGQAVGFALELTVDDVLDGTAAAKLEEAGAEALVLQMKAPSGQLAWASELFTAGWAEVNAPKANNDALRQWNTGEVYTIARVCCFRDDSVPYSMNKVALRRGQNNWRDELGLRWISPASGDGQAYIAQLCGELGAMGFDEIVLEQFHFPTEGNLDNITRGDRYDPARFTDELESLLTQVQAAAEPYGTKISLRFEGGALTDGSGVSGLTFGLLDRFAYRFWTDRDGWTALASSGVQDSRERTVEVVGQAAEKRDLYQAVVLEGS